MFIIVEVNSNNELCVVNCFLNHVMDSMLPCISSVIDHRLRQNVVGTKKWHMRHEASVALMFLPHFEVFCDLFNN